MKHFKDVNMVFVYAIVGVFCLVIITVCALIQPAGAGTQPGPRNGQVVRLGHSLGDSMDVIKWCDGPNLVYQSRAYVGSSLSVLADSPECK